MSKYFVFVSTRYWQKQPFWTAEAYLIWSCFLWNIGVCMSRNLRKIQAMMGQQLNNLCSIIEMSRCSDCCLDCCLYFVQTSKYQVLTKEKKRTKLEQILFQNHLKEQLFTYKYIQPLFLIILVGDVHRWWKCNINDGYYVINATFQWKQAPSNFFYCVLSTCDSFHYNN